MLRFLKYYAVVAAVASLLSVGMGIRMNFNGSNERIYCDFGVEEERANFRTEIGPCRLRIGLIVNVFGRIFLVLFVVLNLPALLIARVWYVNRRQSSLEGTRGGFLARPGPPPVQPSVDENGDDGRFRVLASWIDRHAGSFFIGYLVVTATAAVLLASFNAWVNLDHNSGQDFCSTQSPPGAFNFYSGGEHCEIQYPYILLRGGVLTIAATTILNAPTTAFYLFRYLLKWIRRIRIFGPYTLVESLANGTSRAKILLRKFRAPMIE